MTARSAILEKLTQAAKIRAGEGNKIPNRPDFCVMERDVMDLTSLCNQFETVISKVNGEVIRTSEENLVICIQQLLQDKQVKCLLLPSAHEFQETLAKSVEEILLYDREIEQWKDQLFNNIDASITSTLGGIAETGSLVLWPSLEEPRLMSLVPPIHIAILHKKDIQPTFWHFMKRHNWSQGMPTNALLISGPSKTADIEQTLAYGVHGPKELIVLLVE